MTDTPKCDQCGRAVVAGQARYTIADGFDDKGNWVVSRHYDCHKAREKDAESALDRLKRASGEAHRLLDEIRRKL
jgi:hypothetical protein